ncbi:hypothetical protein ACFQE5_11015 [Pseudonocardia hispaniensis]|uniref:Recombination endonuclease VII n=1 Tax=Pseudonocardia hispaniensis TaxID=904933 RepID=A0ABW1J2T0_9PSEU
MEPPQACHLCGERRDLSDPTSLAWGNDRDDEGRVRWLCPGCTRGHLRDIEARLPDRWW